MLPAVHLGALLLPHAAHLLAEEAVGAGRRLVQHAHDVEQGRLAGAARPHDGDELALLHLQVHVAQHVGLVGTRLVVLLDVVQFDHGSPVASHSVRSVSTGLVRAARIAWCPTVRPATRKDSAPDTTNRPAPISTR